MVDRLFDDVIPDCLAPDFFTVAHSHHIVCLRDPVLTLLDDLILPFWQAIAFRRYSVTGNLLFDCYQFLADPVDLDQHICLDAILH